MTSRLGYLFGFQEGELHLLAFGAMLFIWIRKHVLPKSTKGHASELYFFVSLLVQAFVIAFALLLYL